MSRYIRRSTHVHKLPACFIGGFSDEGERDTLNNILAPYSNEELEIECNTNDDLQHIAQELICAEVAYTGAALTHPIDDPEAKDPSTVQEAESSTYWNHV